MARAEAPATEDTTAATAEPKAQPQDPVLASFRGGQITVSSMEHAVAQKLLPTRAEIAAKGGRERMLTELVNYDLLAAEAERRGYGKHATVRAAALEKIVELLIERGGLTVEPASISNEDVAKRYEERREQFHRAEMRRARHVLLPTLEEAKSVHAAVRQGGPKALPELARMHSKDERTRKQSGELGYFDAEGNPKSGTHRVEPGLAATVFALEGDNVLAPAPVRVANGYSVVMLISTIAAVSQTLEQAAPMIREQLAEERGEAALAALTAKLESEVPIELHLELLSAIELPEGRIGERPQGFPAAPPDPRAPPKVVEPDGF
jgi:peptidyl-prolyl cis-trans isomerase C